MNNDRGRPVLPDPGPRLDVPALLLDYLDFYRATVVAKLDGLPEHDLRSSRLPSGWSPLELACHLVFMERRWLVWGFLGEQVDDPWGDGPGDHWHVADTDSAASLTDRLLEGGRHTRSIVESAAPDATAALTGRFEGADTAPSLVTILLHVVQEYARHTGHLDIVRELADGSTGE